MNLICMCKINFIKRNEDNINRKEIAHLIKEVSTIQQITGIHLTIKNKTIDSKRTIHHE